MSKKHLSIVQQPLRLTFSGSTKASIRFGYSGMLVARNRRTGQWTEAYDVGVWVKIEPPRWISGSDLLEIEYAKWLAYCSKEELHAAGLRNRIYR